MGMKASALGQDLPGTMSLLRVLQIALLGASGVVILFTPRVHANASAQFRPELLYLFLALAIVDVLLIAWAQLKVAGGARARLQKDGSDPQALNELRRGHLISAVIAESVVLYGLVVHALGGPIGASWIFFCLGLLLFAISWPRAITRTV